MKKIFCRIYLVSCVIAGLIVLSNFGETYAKEKSQVACVNVIKGNTVYYYKCNTSTEVPRAIGKIKKARLSKKTSYYVMPDGDNYTPESKPYRVGKKKMQKIINSSRKWNGKGFYCSITIRNRKVTEIEEPYWP